MNFTFAVEFESSFRISGFNNKRTESFVFSFFIEYNERHFKTNFTCWFKKTNLSKLIWLLFPKIKERTLSAVFIICHVFLLGFISSAAHFISTQQRWPMWLRTAVPNKLAQHQGSSTSLLYHALLCINMVVLDRIFHIFLFPHKSSLQMAL